MYLKLYSRIQIFPIELTQALVQYYFLLKEPLGGFKDINFTTNTTMKIRTHSLFLNVLCGFYSDGISRSRILGKSKKHI